MRFFPFDGRAGGPGYPLPSVADSGPKGAAAAPGPFYQSNIGDFETRSLSNGIKLYVKRNKGNRVLNLKLVLVGGSALVAPAKAGLEDTVLSLLSRGSASYDYERVLDFEYRTSSSISHGSGYDYSSYDLNCIDSYLPELLDLYLDGFLRPRFDLDRFRDVRNEAAQAMESRMGDPDQRARFLGAQAVFEGHPYASDPAGTPGALEAVTLDDVKAYHSSLLNADRIFLVAVGNYDVDALAAKLESALGGIPRKGFSPALPGPARTSGAPILEAHPASEGVAYIQGYFRIPGRRTKTTFPSPSPLTC